MSAVDLRACAGCETPHAVCELDPKGRCGICADHQVCGECGEHFIGADGPCPCHAERSALAEARREDDRAAFDAARCALCDAPGAEPIAEARVYDPQMACEVTHTSLRHARRVLAAGTRVCPNCETGLVFFLPARAA